MNILNTRRLKYEHDKIAMVDIAYGRGGRLGAGIKHQPPQQIPGIAKADVNRPSAGYGDSTVQTQLRVDVKESEGAIRFVRSNTDPYVLTKLYTLKHAEPYALRGYLLGVVIRRSPDTGGGCPACRAGRRAG